MGEPSSLTLLCGPPASFFNQPRPAGMPRSAPCAGCDTHHVGRPGEWADLRGRGCSVAWPGGEPARSWVRRAAWSWPGPAWWAVVPWWWSGAERSPRRGGCRWVRCWGSRRSARRGAPAVRVGVAVGVDSAEVASRRCAPGSSPAAPSAPVPSRGRWLDHLTPPGTQRWSGTRGRAARSRPPTRPPPSDRHRLVVGQHRRAEVARPAPGRDRHGRGSRPSRAAASKTFCGSRRPSVSPSRPAQLQVPGRNCSGPTARSKSPGTVVPAVVAVAHHSERAAVEQGTVDRRAHPVVRGDGATADRTGLDLPDRRQVGDLEVAAAGCTGDRAAVGRSEHRLGRPRRWGTAVCPTPRRAGAAGVIRGASACLVACGTGVAAASVGERSSNDTRAGTATSGIARAPDAAGVGTAGEVCAGWPGSTAAVATTTQVTTLTTRMEPLSLIRILARCATEARAGRGEHRTNGRAPTGQESQHPHQSRPAQNRRSASSAGGSSSVNRNRLRSSPRRSRPGCRPRR